LCEYQGESKHIVKKKLEFATEYIRAQYSGFNNSYVMVEDTCLGFTVLNGLPGPYIKCFVKKLGLLGIVELIDKYHDKRAQCSCIIGIKKLKNDNDNDNDNDVQLFKGEVNGIITSPRGPQTFGWDAIFVPEGRAQTFAEMDVFKKNKVSHRYLACQKLKDYLNSISSI
jgi:inosine triphosphate pyrophosphatase